MAVIVGLLLAVTLTNVSAQPAAASAEMQKANSLLQAQKWNEAATAFEAITKAEPSNGRAWFQLGWARHGLSQYAEAIDALQHTLDINKGKPNDAFPMYAIASMYAGMKNKDKAIEWLNMALAAHYPQPRGIAADPNLAVLHDDPRFKEVLTTAAKAANICMSTTEYRGFDFWLGDWIVSTPNGQQAGTNKVVLLADGCVIEENWENTGGGVGKSFNFYNPVTKMWHQSYMDNDGSNWMMDGELKDGVLRYEGAIYSPAGKTLVHMTFFNMGPDKVRQTAETSSDNGKTWVSVWDGTYIRKK